MVDQFHHDNFRQDAGPYNGRQGLGLDKKIFYDARDQIIRDLLEISTRGQVPEENPLHDKNNQKLLPGEENIAYAALFVRRHAYEKIIYLLWDPSVVFYCPDKPISGLRLKASPSDVNEPDNFNENRFFQTAPFYYFGKRDKVSNQKPFSEFIRWNVFPNQMIQTPTIVTPEDHNDSTYRL